MRTTVATEKANMTLYQAPTLWAARDGTSMEHTGTQAQIAVQGPQALGVHDMTDLCHPMARLCELNEVVLGMPRLYRSGF